MNRIQLSADQAQGPVQRTTAAPKKLLDRVVDTQGSVHDKVLQANTAEHDQEKEGQSVDKLRHWGVGHDNIRNDSWSEDIEVEDGIIDQMYQTEIPSKDMILHLANLWPECQAIALIWDYLDLPKGIDGGFMIRYNNGPLANAESSRAPELHPGHEKLFRTAEHKLGDLFLVDYAAGVTQTVCYFGRRFTFGRRRETPHDLEVGTSQSEDLDNGVKYIASDQAAFVSNTPEIAARHAASVPLRCRNQSLQQWRQPPQLSAEECGIIHLTNGQLRNRHRLDTFIMYADSYDPEYDQS
ncbi:hypothetical protein FBULB1_6334 [Fusarium bulbicola]|nr:hypothetical protein FBULB1_6334 [Fusarium bulbicola]